MILNAVMIPLAIILGSLLGGGAAHLILRRRPSSAGSAVVWVCVDCYFAHHGVLEPGTVTDGTPLSLLTDCTVTDGGACEHDPDADPDCECNQQDFGTSPCQGCGSHLAGTRHALTVEWT